MRLLLDTHALLWALDGDGRLDDAARDMLADPSNDVWVSAISLWEIAIKVRIGKLRVDVPELLSLLRPSGFRVLDLKTAHLTQLAALPLRPDHRDPFDHLLIAQALAESLTFMTADGHANRYGAPTVACQ